MSYCLKLKKLYTSRLCYQEDKRSNYDPQLAKCQKQNFYGGFYTPENKTNKKIQAGNKTY